jgi:YfiH family protein
MIDPVHSVIANIHSGWRGTAQGITSKTLDTLANETPFDAASSRAWLGPSIRVCCFEVGEEVAAQFDARYVDRQVASSTSRVHAKPHVDIPAFTKDILRSRGFGDDAIIDTELCTRCDGSIFHSYRRQGKGGGRTLAIVAQ